MVLMSLKAVKFDTKMYLNFSNFRRQTSAGGQALVQKRGQVSDGGLTKFLPEGGPPSPTPREKTWRESRLIIFWNWYVVFKELTLLESGNLRLKPT